MATSQLCLATVLDWMERPIHWHRASVPKVPLLVYLLCVHLSIHPSMCLSLHPSLHVCRLRHSVVSNSLLPHGLQPARLLCLRDSAGKNTGVGCHTLLQGIFPTQGSNLCLSHLRPLAGRSTSVTREALIHPYLSSDIYFFTYIFLLFL